MRSVAVLLAKQGRRIGSTVAHYNVSTSNWNAFRGYAVPIRLHSTGHDHDHSHNHNHDHDGPTIFDTEQQMFQLRRKMTAAYSLGRYQMALEFALDLQSKATQIMGTKNAVYASCLNNVALMYKMLGDQDKALESYTAALHTYMDVTGKDHANYAAALANLGVLYKEMSKGRVVARTELDDAGDGDQGPVVFPVKGLERQNYLDRAEEALVEARETRLRLLGATHKDSLYSAIHLASLWKLREKPQDALALLEEALTTAEAAYTQSDAICASIRNDLGVLYKGLGRFSEAKDHYVKALEVRSKVLGDKNNDTVVSAYNLAELYTAMGEVEQATALQEALVKNLEDRQSSQQTQQEKEQADKIGATATSQTAVTAHSSGDNVLRIHKQVNSIRTPEVVTPVTPPAPSEIAGPQVTDGAEIAKQQMLRDQAETREAQERAKAKAPPVTSATRPTKPATRRKPQQQPV